MASRFLAGMRDKSFPDAVTEAQQLVAEQREEIMVSLSLSHTHSLSLSLSLSVLHHRNHPAFENSGRVQPPWSRAEGKS